jgi:hypothetical protein
MKPALPRARQFKPNWAKACGELAAKSGESRRAFASNAKEVLLLGAAAKARPGEIEAEQQRDPGIEVEQLAEPERVEQPRDRVRRQQEQQHAACEDDPADQGDDDRQRAARPDVMREHHGEAGGERDQAEQEQQRALVHEAGRGLYQGLLVDEHRGRLDEGEKPDQPGEEDRARGHGRPPEPAGRGRGARETCTWRRRNSTASR